MMTRPARLLRSNRFLRAGLQGLAPAILAVVMAGSAIAQDAAPQDTDVEPPSLVGRISNIQGEVSMQRADDKDWSDAGVNQPVTIGDAVYAGDNSEAGVQIGATDIDLKAGAEIDIAALDDNSGRIRLDSGVVELRVSELPTEDGLSIDTPRGTVKLTQVGLYRIDSGTEDQPTQVTAWNGTAQLGDTSAVTVQQGQTLVINGTPDAPQYSYVSNTDQPPAAWRTPPRVVTVAEADRYVAPDMTGSEDLYQYGSFDKSPEYGAVWYPRTVPANWQPYRYGHWQYVRPWGQTWIDDQPWGFAPFHYGRWAFVGNRWGWVPGAYQRRPVYAPALVAFVGGGGFSATISFGGGRAVGWVPLAPGEGYRPPYRASPRYIQNINKTVIVNNVTINKTVINNRPGRRGFGADQQPGTAAGFANRRFATVVPADAMSQRRPVAAAAIKVRPEALEKANVDAQVVRDIKPAPVVNRPGTRPGPIARPPRERPTALNARPALPPAGSRPGTKDRPNAGAGPNRPAPNAIRPGQVPTPPQAGGKPNDRPGAPNGPAARPNRPAPTPPNGLRPGADRPGADRPGPNRPNAKPDTGEQGPAARPAPQDKSKPATDRPGPRPDAARPAPERPANRPDAATPRPSRPEQAQPRPTPQVQPQPRPQVQPRPQPQPRPQAQPQPEPRPQAQPRPQPQPRPQAQPQPRPQPQAQPRPQPQPRPQAQPQPQPRPQAQPRPQPQPQARPQPPAPPQGPAKKDKDKNQNNN